jgi:GNAT superfamily N-acetyltransferase
MIRAARADEAATLAAAYEWLFAPPGFRPPQWEAARAVSRLERLVDADDATMLVADVGGEVVGICSVYLDIESVRFGRRAWIEDLAVHPDHRSAGHGKALLDAAKDWARERGASRLALDSGEARTDAHRFYEREQPAYRSIQFGWML